MSPMRRETIGIVLMKLALDERNREVALRPMPVVPRGRLPRLPRSVTTGVLGWSSSRNERERARRETKSLSLAGSFS